MQYNDQVLALFHAPQHAGNLLLNEHTTRGFAGEPGRSDVVELFIQWNIEKTQVITARFKAQGNVATIACAELFCELIEKKITSQIQTLLQSNWADSLALPSTHQTSIWLVKTAYEQALTYVSCE